MSVDLYVFLSESSLPTTAQWQEAIDRLGVDVLLDGSIDTADHSGFWPTQCGPRALGFEFSTGRVSDSFGAQPPDGLGGRDFVASFVTRSDLQELRCAMLAAAALATETGGVVLYPQSGALMDGSALLTEAQAIDPPT